MAKFVEYKGIRDEAIHGVYISLLAQEIYNKQTDIIKEDLKNFTYNLLIELYENEVEYTQDLYDELGLTHDVKKFVRYNGNKALMNLGFETYFEEEEVNPIVINGLDTKTKSFDFFSMKSSSYQMATVESIKDEDFYFKEDKEGFKIE